MIYTAKMTSKGQITIPKKVREAFGFREGDVIQFQMAGPDELTLRRQQIEGAAWGMLKDKIPKRDVPVSIEEMKRAVEDSAVERFRRATERPEK